VRCPRPVSSLDGHLFNVEEINGVKHIVRLLEFQPGEILYSVQVDPELCVQTGSYLAQIDTILEGFSHPAYKNHSTIWALDSVPKLDSFLYAVTDQHQKQLAGHIISCFKEVVVPIMDTLPKGICFKNGLNTSFN